MAETEMGFPRHPLLPAHMTNDELAEWLQHSAVDQFTDSQKRIFTQEEIQEFEHESSVQGREINRLKDLLSLCAEHVKKGGNEEELTVTFPKTVGTKVLEDFRRQNDDLIEAGAELTETRIFGIVNPDEETMEFFTIDGVHIPDRTRGLSAKEKHKHLGMFQRGSNSKVFIAKDADHGKVNTDTGEQLNGDERTGTNG